MMDSLQTDVYTALQGTGYTVLYLYPQGETNVPCVTWYESNNREYGQAGGNEFVTEVEYHRHLGRDTRSNGNHGISGGHGTRGVAAQEDIFV